jgi:multidrug resistance efflux pump
VWLGGVLLASSLTAAFLTLRLHARDSGPDPVLSGPGVPPAERRVVALGHVDVEQGVTPLYPLQAGRVTRIDAQEGKPAEAGQPLFTLEDTAARLQVDEARVALDAARVRQDEARRLADQHAQQVAALRQAIEAARTDVELARVQRDRAKRRSEDKLANPDELRSAELLVRKAEANQKGEEAKLAALEARNPKAAVDLAAKDVAAKQIDVRKAEEALKEYTVRAPFKGTALRVLISVGEVLGSPPRQPAIHFCPDAPRIVRAEVEQEFAARVKPGQEAEIEDDATGGGRWSGRVERVSDWYTQRRSVLLEPLQLNDVRTLECIIRLTGDPAGLRIGQRVRVNLR